MDLAIETAFFTSLNNDAHDYKAVDLTNVIAAGVIKNPVMVEHHDENGKAFKRKEYYCTLNIHEHIIPTNKDLGLNLLSLKEKKIFKDNVEVHFGPYEVSFTDDAKGIECEVKEILNLGNEKLAILDAFGSRIVAKADESLKLGPARFTINLDGVSFYDTQKNIRLA